MISAVEIKFQNENQKMKNMNKLHLKEIKLEELNSTMDIIYAVTGAAIVGGGVLIIT